MATRRVEGSGSEVQKSTGKIPKKQNGSAQKSHQMPNPLAMFLLKTFLLSSLNYRVWAALCSAGLELRLALASKLPSSFPEL